MLKFGRAPPKKVKTTERKLAEGIILHSEEREGPPYEYWYKVEVKLFKKISFTFNFTGSDNFNVKEGGRIDGLKTVVEIEPLSTSAYIKFVQTNIYKEADMALAMSWTTHDPDPETQRKYLQDFDTKMGNILAEAKMKFQTPVSNTLPKAEITSLCKRNKMAFVDLSFPPSLDAISKVDVDDADAPAQSSANNTAVVDRKAIVWRRPSEFSNGKPYVVFGPTIEANDVKQGALGDCWLMCVLAALAEFPAMVKNIFPANFDTYSPEGVYKVLLYRCGMLEEVLIDDFFPCVPEGGPVYSQTHGNELWVLLVEKAFAKANGSYAAIRLGYPIEALIDLTGSPVKEVKFSDADVKQKIRDGSLWATIANWDQENYVMSLATGGVDTFTEGGGQGSGAHGLIPGHAYTLIAAKVTSSGVKLLQIRNPWGRMEWDGDWSDHSPLWTPELKAELGQVDADDGIFWMSFEDMLKYFVSMCVCFARHPAHLDNPWCEARTPFQLKFAQTGHACVGTETYSFITTEPTQLFLAVHQHDHRHFGSQEYIDVRVAIKRVLPNGSTELVATTKNKVDRQVQLEVESLPAGTYTIEPNSTGVRIEQIKDKKLAKGHVVVDGDFGRDCVLTVHSSADFTLSNARTNEIIHSVRPTADPKAGKIPIKATTRPILASHKLDPEPSEAVLEKRSHQSTKNGGNEIAKGGGAGGKKADVTTPPPPPPQVGPEKGNANVPPPPPRSTPLPVVAEDSEDEDDDDDTTTKVFSSMFCNGAC